MIISFSCPAQVKLEVGQVIPDTFLAEGQVKFAEKDPSKYSVINKIIGRAGIIGIKAGKFWDILAHEQVNQKPKY